MTHQYGPDVCLFSCFLIPTLVLPSNPFPCYDCTVIFQSRYFATQHACVDGIGVSILPFFISFECLVFLGCLLQPVPRSHGEWAYSMYPMYTMNPSFI